MDDHPSSNNKSSYADFGLLVLDNRANVVAIGIVTYMVKHLG